jgi:Restriction endonuclease BglII
LIQAGGEKKVYPYRDMEFVKDKLGVEVQVGKYSFMVYNICAKMTIFRNLGHIETGIEIVLSKNLLNRCPPVSHILNNVYGISSSEAHQILTCLL